MFKRMVGMAFLLMGCGLFPIYLDAAPLRRWGPTKKVTPPKVVVLPPSGPVGTIVVTGNRWVASSDIVSESGWQLQDDYDEFKVARSIRSIMNMGVFQSVSITANRMNGQATQLVMTVRENSLIQGIQIEGVTVVSASELAQALQSKPGEIWRFDAVRSDARTIEAIYANKGYRLAKVVHYESPEENGNLIFWVDEGVVGAIAVTGNYHTRSYVILREFLTKPGMVFQSDRLNEDLRRVYNLGYFTGLAPDLIDPMVWKSLGEEAPTSGQVLVLKVDEKSSNTTLTAALSYSPVIGITGSFSTHLDNLFGTGQLVDAQLQLGRATTIQLKYFNPWMWDNRRSFMARIWNRNGSVDQFMLNSSSVTFRDEQAFGVDLMFGVPISYELNLTHTFKIENVYLPGYNIQYSLQTYRFGVSYDNRDVRFNPLNGHYAFGSFEYSIPLSSNSLDFYRLDLEWRSFFKTFDQQTIAMRWVTGAIFSSRIDNSQLFAREYYRMGGAYTVRGWNDYNPFAIGSRQGLASLEYRWQVHDMVQLVAFVDMGFASNDHVFDLSRYRIGKGVGVRFNIPALGPVRLDWAMGDYSDSVIHFSMGHAF